MELRPIEDIRTLKELGEYRKEINEALDSREKFISKCMVANDLANGSFYCIKENFESLSPKLFKSEHGKYLLNKYKSVVKESHNLTSLYSLYENIRKANNSVDLDYFVNSLTENKWVKNGDTLSDDIRKLGSVLAEAYIETGDILDIKPENKKLDEAVRYIVENKKTSNNISEYSGAIKIIKEHIASKEGSMNVVSEAVNLDSFVEKLVNEFNKKYDTNNLSQEEFNIMKEFCESTNHEAIFEQHKQECKTKLTEVRDGYLKNGDNESANKLSTILEQIDSKHYNSEQALSDVVSLVGLTNIFQEEK